VIGFKRETEKELAEEKPGTSLGVQEIGVLADRAKASHLGQLSFEHRPRVDIASKR
jgi:hypothetical protein